MATQTELDNLTDSALVSSETVTETTTYTDAERQTNAMTASTKQLQLAAKRKALSDYIASTLAAKLQMKAEIETLEAELSEINTGVTTGSITKQVIYDIYNTGTELVSFPRGVQKLIANIKNSVSLTESTSSSETSETTEDTGNSDGNNEINETETSSESTVQDQLEQAATDTQAAISEGLNKLKNLFGNK